MRPYSLCHVQMCFSNVPNNHYPSHLNCSYLQYHADGETWHCRPRDCGQTYGLILRSRHRVCMICIFTDLKRVCLTLRWPRLHGISPISATLLMMLVLVSNSIWNS